MGSWIAMLYRYKGAVECFMFGATINEASSRALNVPDIEVDQFLTVELKIVGDEEFPVGGRAASGQHSQA
jgi:hypothetical protein